MSFTESVEELVARNRSGLLGAHPSWGRVRLGDVATILNGFPFPSGAFAKESGTPLIRIRDIADSVTEARYRGGFDPQYLIHAGDLLVGMDGDFNCALWRGPTGLLNQRVCKISPSERFLGKRFLVAALPAYLRAINHATSSVTVKHLSSRTLADVPMPLPPRKEQERIADEVEKQFTRLDAAVAALERTQANLKRYRASVLKSAYEGRLVPTEAELARREGRSFETGEELKQRILRERTAHWREATDMSRSGNGNGARRSIRETHYEEPTPPRVEVEVPRGWTTVSLDQLLTETLSNGRSVPDRDGGFPVLRLTCLSGGMIDLTATKEGAWTAGEAKPFIVREGDFLIARGNGSLSLVGCGGAVLKADREVAYPDTLIRARTLRSHYSFGLLRLIWNSALVRRQIERLARTTAGIYKVNQDHLRAIALPLPPLAEQHRIVAEVDRRLSVVDELEATVEKNLARCARLRQSILKMAFEGRLVPQDPSDEPASVLLERIRKEREASTAPADASRRGRPAGRSRAKERK